MKSAKLTAILAFSLVLGMTSVSVAQVSVSAVPIIAPGPRYVPDLVTEGNLWVLTGYRDEFRHRPYPVRHTFCYFFLGKRGTHDMYAWISTSYAKWWGYSIQEGDGIRQIGNFAPAISKIPLTRWREVNWRGHSASQFELVSRRRGPLVPRDMASGHISANIEPGFARVFANMKLVRIGRCLPHLADRIKGVLDAKDGTGDVEITDDLSGLLVAASGEISERILKDGSLAESPFDDLSPLDTFPGE